MKFGGNELPFLHHAAEHSVSPRWCCWTCCPLFPGTRARLSPSCCSCWAWIFFSWQWFGCWHLSAVLALLDFFGCFLDSYESSMSLPSVLPSHSFSSSLSLNLQLLLLPFSLTSFILPSLNNLCKHHRAKTTLYEKGDPCSPQFREDNVSTHSAELG